MAYAVTRANRTASHPGHPRRRAHDSTGKHADRQHQREHRGRDDAGRATDGGAEGHGSDDAQHHGDDPWERRVRDLGAVRRAAATTCRTT